MISNKYRYQRYVIIGEALFRGMLRIWILLMNTSETKTYFHLPSFLYPDMARGTVDIRRQGRQWAVWPRKYNQNHVFWSSLQWRHNECDSVSNHQPHDCLLNHLLRRRSMKTSKLHVTGLCAGNSPVTGEFPAQRASNAEMFPFDDVIMSGDYVGVRTSACIALT